MPAKNLGNSGVLFTDRRKFYLNEMKVAELYPAVTPFVTTLMNKPAVSTPDPNFKMFEHRSTFLKQEFSANDADGMAWSGTTTGVPGETATIDAIDGIVGLASTADDSYLGQICEIRTSDRATFKGLCIITAVSSGALTVKSLGNPRAVTGLCSTLADNDIFTVVTDAFGEGTEAPEADSDEIEVVYNSCQIFKIPVEITGTLLAAALRGYSNELARLRQEKEKRLKMHLNRAFLLGTRAYGTGMTDLAGNNVTTTDAFGTEITDASGKVVRTTMGIISALYRYGTTSGDQQNIFNIVKGGYDYNKFVDDTEKVFQYLPSNGVYTAVCGMGVLSYFSKLAGTDGFGKNSKFKVVISDWRAGKLGFNVRTLETPHGMIDLAYDPALRGDYKDTMCVFNMDHIDRVVYRPQKYETNIKTDNAYDGVKDQFFADEGLGISLIERHSIWNFS